MSANPLIRVLGPIDVVVAGEVCPVGGHRPRELLGALVVGAGHAVGIEHLYEVLWGEELPATASNTLQSYVSDLRYLLGPDAIVLTDHSYALDTGSVDLDAVRFQRLVRLADEARADSEQRLRLCREALGLWRGRPFGDLADEPAFVFESRRLDELRMVAVELALEADLALGRHELVVGELESAVEEYPYRERLWFLLVEALAIDGRRVEALRACARLRRILAGVGLEISGEIAAVEQQILEGEPVDPARWSTRDQSLGVEGRRT